MWIKAHRLVYVYSFWGDCVIFGSILHGHLEQRGSPAWLVEETFYHTGEALGILLRVSDGGYLPLLARPERGGSPPPSLDP